MTQILISVTSIAEAKIALDNGADIIDLKDPSAGALGALPLPLIQTIVSYINGQKLVSATIGDVAMQPDLILPRVRLLAKAKIDYIKIGFFESSDFQPCLDALQAITEAGEQLIAVLFAEHTYPDDLILAIKKAGFIGIMLDTATKNGHTFLDYYSEPRRKAFAQKVLALDLTFGLAGSLKLQHIAIAKELNPTYMGFRGGVCDENKRELGLNADKIKAISKVM